MTSKDELRLEPTAAHVSPTLALVLTPLSRNESSLPNFYWTPLFEALKSEGIALAIYQPRRLKVSVPHKRGGRRRIPIVSPLFVFSLLRTAPSAVLSTEYGPHTLMALVAARLMKSKGLIFKEHADSAGLSYVRLLYRRALTALAWGIVANTDAGGRDVKSSLRAHPDRVHRLSLLVPPERSQLMRGAIPLSLQGSVRPIFLYTGRLVELKNVTNILEAAAALRSDGLRFSVRIVGDGPSAAGLVARASELNLDDTVTFTRAVPYDAIGHLYGGCDVFVMPSLADYRSVAVLEAMRFAMPIIDSTGDGNAGDSVIHGLNGLLFDPRDVPALVWAMKQFIDDPTLIKTMGESSARLIADQTPSTAASKLLTLLTQSDPL